MWEVITSLFGGGITGLIGSIISKVFEYKTKKLDIEQAREKYTHELQMRKADAEIMAQEWAARTKMSEVEAAGREAVADSEAFRASFNEPTRYSEGVSPNSAQGWLLIALDALRALVRPGLTIYLCVVTTFLYVDAHKLLRADDFTNTQAEKLVTQIIATILYLTTTCVLWWFGARQKTSPPMFGEKRNGNREVDFGSNGF